MALHVNREKTKLTPDFKKVIPRFFNTGNERSLEIIKSVLQMPDADAKDMCVQVLKEFSSRYRDIAVILTKHFEQVTHLLPAASDLQLTEEKKLLIGAYFTMEYAIEAAALFNPSIVEDPDQSGTGPGQKKVIVSLRATGESHISSLVFRNGILDEEGNISIAPPGKFISEGIITKKNIDNKQLFDQKLSQMRLPEDIYARILDQLNGPFSYNEVDTVLKNTLQHIEPEPEKNKIRYDILSLVDASYELHFPPSSNLSERIIFPVTFTEKNGIEDARFVRFTDDDGSVTYYATYTAYDGSFILPKIIKTKDFCHFTISSLYGKAAVNKNLALFPRKINGKYVMLSRIDGVNNYLMFSDDLHTWEEATLLQRPKYPWEFVQVGNGGSPIETEKGWLVITHGVGPMRKYCLGASLFDLDNPAIELGRLKQPLLVPNEHERDGYVPNVVYSCGSIIHQDKLFIPYAVSDYASSFATIPLAKLLHEILESDSMVE